MDKETEDYIDVPDIENQGNVLFVDDEENILTALRRLFRKHPIRCFFASSGEEGLLILQQESIDIIVSDMRMPKMNGAEFLTLCKQRWPKTIRMLLTGHSDIGTTIDALNNGGIYRYLPKPWNDEELIEAIDQGLRLCRLEKEKLSLLKLTRQQNHKLIKFNEELEHKVAARTEEIKQTSDMLELVYQQLQDSYSVFIKLFSSVIASRKYLEKSKPQYVADLTKKMAIALKLPVDEIKHIYHAALLMDLGKLNLTDDILQLPEDNISAEHRFAFERHPLLAEMTLSAISELGFSAKVIRNHMEAVDGSGFPDKLKAGTIPRGARILRVARDFVGLQTGLIKEICLDVTEAFNNIKSMSGKKYDPAVIRVLETLAHDFNLGGHYSHEILVDVRHLTPGLVVSRDVYNAVGILMIAKNFTLTESIIEKLVSINAMNDLNVKIFVYKDEGMAQ